MLGRRHGGVARIDDFILYDDLDWRCLDSGIVHFDGRYFAELWAECERCDRDVVADVHTHPRGVQQSASDRAHPMVAEKGHLAFILPNFARAPVRPAEVGIYRYSGVRSWEPVSPAARSSFFYVGI